MEVWAGKGISSRVPIVEQAVEYFQPKLHRRELWYVRGGGEDRIFSSKVMIFV